MIALEPEAASLFCTAKKLNEPGSVSVGAELSQPNTHYMIVDIGGKCIVHVCGNYSCVSTRLLNYLTQEKSEISCSVPVFTNSAIQAELRIRDKICYRLITVGHRQVQIEGYLTRIDHDKRKRVKQNFAPETGMLYHASLVLYSPLSQQMTSKMVHKKFALYIFIAKYLITIRA